MPNPFQFYKDEREEHKFSIGVYAGRRDYVSALPMIIEAQEENAMDVLLEMYPNVRWVNKYCDNINLCVDNRGGWCELCAHYHFRYPFGIELSRCVQEFKQDGDKTVEIEVEYLGSIEVSTFDEKCVEHKVEIPMLRKRKVARPKMLLVEERWEGKYPPGTMIHCYWNPDAGTDCMSFGNQEPTTINPGKYRSDWTSTDWSDPDNDDEKAIKQEAVKVRRSLLLKKQDALRKEKEAALERMKQFCPELYS